MVHISLFVPGAISAALHLPGFTGGGRCWDKGVRNTFDPLKMPTRENTPSLKEMAEKTAKTKETV